MKAGYNKTEVGIIPADWDVHSLGKLGEALIGLTYKPTDVREHGTLVLRSSNIQDDALAFDDNVFVDTVIPDRIMARPGDVLVCVRNGSRNLIGKSALLDERTLGMTFGAFMATYRSPIGKLASYLFQSDIIKRQINEHLGATINQITNKSLNSFLVPLPKNDTERDAITQALSEVDALITALNRLIAKKRDIKQAATQQLLTGKTRLPGFHGEWELKKFEEVTVLRRERIDPRRDGVHDFCVELEHIESGSGQILGSTSTSNQSSMKSVFYDGDVLFGKLRAYLRKYWRASRHGVCSTEIWVLVPRAETITPEFLFHVIQTDGFIDTAGNSYGTHMPRSDWNVVKNYKFSLPSVPEQVAIAAVLSDMDAELSSLQARRVKTRALKQGMIQELLTGKTRLI